VASAPSCPLPYAKQVKAVKAFAEMMPVFRHPRCLNCHGGVDPFEEEEVGGHRGGAMEQSFPINTAQCQDCHDGLPGWMVPPLEDLMFVGKSDEELCLQMKHREKTGAEFVGHIFNDHDDANVQFIAAGFKGDRALGEGLADYDLVAEKPPGTQAQLTDKARKWVETLGDGYTASPECGCVKPSLKLEIRHRSAGNTNDAPSRAGHVDFSGEVKFEVTLVPVEGLPDGWHRADTTLHRPLRVDLVNRHCRGEASQDEEWNLFGRINLETETLELNFGIYPEEERGSATCRTGGHVDTKPLEPSLFYEMERITIPLDSTAPTTLTATDPSGGAQEWITVRLVEY